jgi:glutathione peroxidase-family protein
VTAFQAQGGEAPGGIYDVPVRDAEGRQRTLGEYRGDVLLIVNTASY